MKPRATESQVLRLEPRSRKPYLLRAHTEEWTLSTIARFLGDSPLRVFLKLLVVSFLVGLVMHAFGWDPVDVLYAIRDFFVEIWNMGWSAIERFASYIILGAAIVVPAFIILRLLSYRR